MTSHAYVIEAPDATAGIVVREPIGYRFFSSDRRFGQLEGQVFATPAKAEHAVRGLRRIAAVLLGLLMLGSAVGTPAQAAGDAAESYPSKAIRVIVPVAPGGSLDVLARILGKGLNEKWGQPVVVENHGGAGGNIAFELVARAPNDGYTLLIGWDSLVINPSIYAKPGFDPVRDFAPIIQTVSAPQILVVNPKFPAKDLAAFVELAQKGDHPLNVGSPGSGSIGHLALQLFQVRVKGRFTHVPYRGGGPAAADLAAGQLDAVFLSLPAVTELVRGNKLRALAVTTLTRSSALPDVPTVAEAGVSDYEVDSWQGLLAPAGTPDAIVAKLNAQIGATLADPATRKFLIDQGFQPVGGTPDRLRALLAEGTARWPAVVASAGVRVD